MCARLDVLAVPSSQPFFESTASAAASAGGLVLTSEFALELEQPLVLGAALSRPRQCGERGPLELLTPLHRVLFTLSIERALEHVDDIVVDALEPLPDDKTRTRPQRRTEPTFTSTRAEAIGHVRAERDQAAEPGRAAPLSLRTEYSSQ